MVMLLHADFNRLKELIYTQCGINITDVKRTMLEARLSEETEGTTNKQKW